MAFFLLLHRLRFSIQVLLVTKVLLDLFISNLYNIKNIVPIFNLFFWLIYLFVGNTQLIFYI